MTAEETHPQSILIGVTYTTNSGIANPGLPFCTTSRTKTIASFILYGGNITTSYFLLTSFSLFFIRCSHRSIRSSSSRSITGCTGLAEASISRVGVPTLLWSVDPLQLRGGRNACVA